jgi:hypothetical protein
MEPRRYITLATWSKDRIERMAALQGEAVIGAELDELEDTNVVSFSAAIEQAPSQLNEAA